MNEWIKQQFASPNQSIREVMKLISNAKIGIAVVVDDNNHLQGYVTDSDIRRAILRDVDLDSSIAEVMNKKPVTLEEGLSDQEALDALKKSRVNRAPVVNKEGVVVDIALYWRLQEKLGEKPAEAVDFTIDIPKDAKKGKKVLVIGAAGYVGSIVCRELLAEGYQVRGLDRFMFGDESIKEIVDHENFELVRGDIRNLDVLVDSCFGVDAVVNFAAIVGDPACDLDVNHTIMINYFSAKAAADAARHCKVDRYIFASTAAIYGASSGKSQLTETSPVAPVSLYAETKYKSEGGILSLKDDNFSPVIFRLGTVYGLSPRMRFDLVVNLFALHAYTNKKITVFGGTQWRPYVHVKDIARAVIKTIKADKKDVHGEIFNLGSEELNLRVVDLAEKIAKIFPGTELNIQSSEADQRDYNVNFDKIRKALDFEAEWNIEKAVEEIKERFDAGDFQDFTDKKYSNVKLQESLIYS